MKKEKHNLVLSFVAGFADTATFLGADGIFSAHVTGNFVVFSHALVMGEENAFFKILTFPIFVLGVVFIGFFFSRGKKAKLSFYIMSFLLMLSGVLYYSVGKDWYWDCFLMTVVFAMGMLNASHKTFLKGTPMPAVMTGNVTQLFLDISTSFFKSPYIVSLSMVFSFLLGCLSGGWMTLRFGLSSIFLCGFLIFISTFITNFSKEEL